MAACGVQLISRLSMLNLPARLEAARRACAARFPMQEEEWSAWIQESMNSIQDDRDAHRLLQLTRQALVDYLSVNLWQQYLVYVLLIHSFAPFYSGLSAVR
jgi:hypothetical protein